MAVKSGWVEVVESLLTRDELDPNRKDDLGRTALWHAILNGQSKVIKVLLDREDTDLNVPDPGSGQSPLAWATANVKLSLVKLLLEKESVDVNARDNDGRTPLALAYPDRNTVSPVRLLLSITVKSDLAEIGSLLRAAGAVASYSKWDVIAV